MHSNSYPKPQTVVRDDMWDGRVRGPLSLQPRQHSRPALDRHGHPREELSTPSTQSSQSTNSLNDSYSYSTSSISASSSAFAEEVVEDGPSSHQRALKLLQPPYRSRHALAVQRTNAVIDDIEARNARKARKRERAQKKAAAEQPKTTVEPLCELQKPSHEEFDPRCVMVDNSATNQESKNHAVGGDDVEQPAVHRTDLEEQKIPFVMSIRYFLGLDVHLGMPQLYFLFISQVFHEDQHGSLDGQYCRGAGKH
jgi:hypothetical protein